MEQLTVNLKFPQNQHHLQSDVKYFLLMNYDSTLMATNCSTFVLRKKREDTWGQADDGAIKGTKDATILMRRALRKTR